MAHFEIEGKEYELKLTFDSIKYLNKVCPGGSLELVGKAMTGDLEVFAHVIHAGLFHAGKNFSFAEIEAILGKAVEEEKLDLEYVLKVSKEVVVDSFFFKKIVKKLMKDNPEALEQLENFLK